MVSTNVYYLLLGGNDESSLTLFKAADELLSAHGEISNRSSIYQSESWGFQSEKLFLNQALEFKTMLSPLTLLEKIHFIEQKLGRIRLNGQQYSDRSIDIDILLYNSEVFEDEQLTIPHKQLHLRGFALVPLLDLCSDYQHPKLRKSIHELYINLKDFSPKAHLC
jgi:2-amino-4-hydroxy-6-hydroxymethyldihydropteridine diphosphokinase